MAWDCARQPCRQTKDSRSALGVQLLHHGCPFPYPSRRPSPSSSQHLEPGQLTARRLPFCRARLRLVWADGAAAAPMRPSPARRVNKMPRSHAEKCARRAGVSVRPAGALSPGWRCGRPGDRPRPRGIRCTRASCDRGGAARRPGAVYLTGPSLWRLANSG